MYEVGTTKLQYHNQDQYGLAENGTYTQKMGN